MSLVTVLILSAYNSDAQAAQKPKTRKMLLSFSVPQATLGGLVLSR